MHDTHFLPYLFKLQTLLFLINSALFAFLIPYLWHVFLRFQKSNALLRTVTHWIKATGVYTQDLSSGYQSFILVFIPITLFVFIISPAIRIINPLNLFTNIDMFPISDSIYYRICLPIGVLMTGIFIAVKKLDNANTAAKFRTLFCGIGYCASLYLIILLIFFNTMIVAYNALPNSLAIGGWNTVQSPINWILLYVLFFTHVLLASILITRSLQSRVWICVGYFMYQLIAYYLFYMDSGM